MPELFSEMRVDLKEAPLYREFIIVPKMLRNSKRECSSKSEEIAPVHQSQSILETLMMRPFVVWSF